MLKSIHPISKTKQTGPFLSLFTLRTQRVDAAIRQRYHESYEYQFIPYQFCVYLSSGGFYSRRFICMTRDQRNDLLDRIGTALGIVTWVVLLWGAIKIGAWFFVHAK